MGAEAAAIAGGVGFLMEGTSAVLGEISRGKGAEAQAKAFEFEAQVADKNATLIREQAFFDEKKQRVLGAKAVGAATAQYANAGVTISGSALDVLQQSAANAEADVMNIRKRGEATAQAYETEAMFSRMKAEYAKAGAEFDWAKVGLQTVGAAADAYPKIFNKK